MLKNKIKLIIPIALLVSLCFYYRILFKFVPSINILTIGVIIAVLRTMFFGINMKKKNYIFLAIVLVHQLFFTISYSSEYMSDLILSNYLLLAQILNLLNILAYLYLILDVIYNRENRYIPIAILYFIISLLGILEILKDIELIIEMIIIIYYIIIYLIYTRKGEKK